MESDRVDDTQGRRRGRRKRDEGADGQPAPPQQPPWRQSVRPFAPVDLVPEEHIETIHQTSLQILSEIGMDFLNDEARQMLGDAGARVDPNSARVRFDADFIDYNKRYFSEFVPKL
jgi:trimethylamine--corrinoid protein Co-methyltransferase